MRCSSNKKILSRIGAKTFQTGRRNYGCLAHRHRFEDLVLDAAGDSQRDHGHGGFGKVWPDVWYLTDQLNPRQFGQALDSRDRAAAYKMYCGVGARAKHQRPDFIAEPGDTIDVGAIVQGAKENAARLVWLWERMEIVQVDAVGHHFD
ncbi:MAG TPA: hypothetical protein VE988_09680, partial [Gemmataceae bacterium]|nr:hypothetical protein [Gemmataceae bacterium]